jgi:selenide,water dikinase
MLLKSGGRPGDLLFLTKPVGGGLITTGTKHGLTDSGSVAAAIEVMTTVNSSASRQALEAGATAMTDVTGYGLLGHLHEVCAASGVAAEVRAAAVPVIDGALDLVADGRCQAGGSRRNAEHAESFTRWSPAVVRERRVILTDAMTSGGLLLAIGEDGTDRAPGACIGRLRPGIPGRITVV